LRLAETVEPTELSRSDPMRKGKVVHAILAEFLTRMRDTGRLPIDAASLADLMVIADRHFDSFARSGAAGPPLTWRVERARLDQFFRDFIAAEVTWQRDRGFRPTLFEQSFGDDIARPAAPPVEMRLDGGQSLRFVGRIDRVDRAASDGAVYITDYKGKSVPNTKDDKLAAGRAMQLPIYLLAARTMVDDAAGAAMAGGRYVSYESRGEPPATLEFDAADWRRVHEVVGGIAGLIHDGAFPQFTVRKSCDYCPFDRVCLGAQRDLESLKAGDPATQRLLEVKSGPGGVAADSDGADDD
jgi:RecB family exonuclease